MKRGPLNWAAINACTRDPDVDNEVKNAEDAKKIYLNQSTPYQTGSTACHQAESDNEQLVIRQTANLRESSNKEDNAVITRR